MRATHLRMIYYQGRYYTVIPKRYGIVTVAARPDADAMIIRPGNSKYVTLVDIRTAGEPGDPNYFWAGYVFNRDVTEDPRVPQS